MLRVNGIKIDIKNNQKQILKKTSQSLGIKENCIKSLRIVRRSVDARKKDIKFVYLVDAEVENGLKYKHSNSVTEVNEKRYIPVKSDKAFEKRPVVVGFGPAGMFCALTLAEAGARPIVLERGEDVDARTKSVEHFWNTGELNAESNVQFGEGGAGTFSDGKLTTRIKNERCGYVLEKLIESGAPEDIAYVHNPHIGTDVLKGVVKSIRERIIALGGEVRFSSKVTDIETENGALKSVTVNNNEKIECDHVAFAPGHSARDTFYMLYDRGLAMEQKPFAVGARIEHNQTVINKAQYGDEEVAEILGPAEYKLTYTTEKGRGVYTFCMCPGGHVVAAASEEGLLAVNGMSYHSRNGENANSAVLVQVSPDDFGSDHPLAGVEFQRNIERKAFEAGGGRYTAPCQRVGSLLGIGYVDAVSATYRPCVKETDLKEVLPEFVVESIKEALPVFGRRIVGFDAPEAILTAPESRSSSPVRLLRETESGESINIKGIFPSGEGAGYAGGIMSAAVDGITIAEKIIKMNNR
ncbi:MAG: FAD-dependent oxidoreductase [Firmicutes bacterium]|nr:FAD-dependent oxidoreductase [Bacillota bacterium]